MFVPLGTELHADRSAFMRNANWLSLAREGWYLNMEASAVIAMRLVMFTTWDLKAQKEAELMVAEKIGAVLELQMRAITGRLGATPYAAISKSTAHYRKVVASNRRRLAKASGL